MGRHGVVTLTQAREMAKATAGCIANGKDPQEEKQIQREKGETESSDNLRVYVESTTKDHGCWKHNKRGGSNIYVLNRYFLHLMSKPITLITAAEIEKWQFKERARKNKRERPLKPTINRNP
ncbi:MAG: integrase arm-type DNA-binding domain-containing protein [Halioglobus sp.]